MQQCVIHVYHQYVLCISPYTPLQLLVQIVRISHTIPLAETVQYYGSDHPRQLSRQVAHTPPELGAPRFTYGVIQYLLLVSYSPGTMVQLGCHIGCSCGVQLGAVLDHIWGEIGCFLPIAPQICSPKRYHFWTSSHHVMTSYVSTNPLVCPCSDIMYQLIPPYIPTLQQYPILLYTTLQDEFVCFAECNIIGFRELKSAIARNGPFWTYSSYHQLDPFWTTIRPLFLLYALVAYPILPLQIPPFLGTQFQVTSPQNKVRARVSIYYSIQIRPPHLYRQHPPTIPPSDPLETLCNHWCSYTIVLLALHYPTGAIWGNAWCSTCTYQLSTSSCWTC